MIYDNPDGTVNVFCLSKQEIDYYLMRYMHVDAMPATTEKRRNMLRKKMNTFGTLPVTKPALNLQKISDVFYNRVEWPPVMTVNSIPTQEGKKKMCYDCDMDAPRSENDIKRDFLISELRTAFRSKELELERAFGLADTYDRPATLKELVDRIQKGQFVLPEKIQDEFPYDPLYAISWRDPSIKKDNDGFKAAFKVLEDKQTDTQRTIKVMDPVDGLKALKDFETATFH